MRASVVTALIVIMLTSCNATNKNNNLDQNIKAGESVATFAGGCFWCMESPFEKAQGVIRVTSGYTGGQTKNPTYEEVCAGTTGHMEAVQVTYNPAQISYLKLLDLFWKSVDPTDNGGQFVDRGSQYRPAIFYHTLHQKRLADATKSSLDKAGVFSKPIEVAILSAQIFYPAEEYHQDFHTKSPVRYCSYRAHSGRDEFIEKSWKNQTWSAESVSLSSFKKPTDQSIKQLLTSQEANVTQCSATEPAFNNQYWDNHREGIYVDVVTGEPVFSSKDKFESGTGWPSFTRPIASTAIATKEDGSHGMNRIEVRSRTGNSHLGHLFDDGPAPSKQRYCINSSALLFIPKEEMQKEGYGAYLPLLDK